MNPEKRARLAARPWWRRALRRLVQAAGVLAVLGLTVLAVAYFRSTNECYASSAAAPAHPMNALIYCDYGAPDVLRIEQVEKPVPGENQIVAKVRAASVNPYDWHFSRGRPYFMRLSVGLRRPKDTSLGVDFAGVVESVGPGVTRFKPGDEIFGGGHGAFAEYARAHESRVAQKPAALTFEQAAAIPIAGLTALQALRDYGKLQPGQKVLINGASGGVGTFAVQLAKNMGGVVSGVCSGRNVDLVRSLGATRVFDYTKEDFTRSGERYDLIVDNVGNRDLSEYRRVLAPEGRYFLIGGGGVNDHKLIGPLGRIGHMVLVSKFVNHEMRMMIAKMGTEDLAALAGMIEAGAVTPVIDRRYPLAEAAEAFRYVESGRARGKVIVSME